MRRFTLQLYRVNSVEKIQEENWIKLKGGIVPNCVWRDFFSWARSEVSNSTLVTWGWDCAIFEEVTITCTVLHGTYKGTVHRSLDFLVTALPYFCFTYFGGILKTIDDFLPIFADFLNCFILPIFL